MQCVVLAGGLGTRIKDFSVGKPKALVEINNVPFLELKLNQLRSEGVDKVVIAVDHMADQIVRFVATYTESSAAEHMNITCIEDGEYSGTLGALIGLNERGILDEEFLLTFGDNIPNVNHRKVFQYLRSSKSLGVMTVIKSSLVDIPSNCDLDGEKIVCYDKQTSSEFGWVDYGLTAFRLSALEGSWPKNGDLGILISSLVGQGQLAGFECVQPFFEIGSPDGLETFRKHDTASALYGDPHA